MVFTTHYSRLSTIQKSQHLLKPLTFKNSLRTIHDFPANFWKLKEAQATASMHENIAVWRKLRLQGLPAWKGRAGWIGRTLLHLRSYWDCTPVQWQQLEVRAYIQSLDKLLQFLNQLTYIQLFSILKLHIETF